MKCIWLVKSPLDRKWTNSDFTFSWTWWILMNYADIKYFNWELFIILIVSQLGLNTEDLLSVRWIHAAEFTSAHTHFLPSSAEETQIIHLHINSNPIFHHLGCKKINRSSTDWLWFSVSYQHQLNAVRQECWGRGSGHQLLYFHYMSTRWRHGATAQHTPHDPDDDDEGFLV